MKVFFDIEKDDWILPILVNRFSYLALMKTRAKHIIIVVGILVAYLAVTNNQNDTRRMRGFTFNIADYQEIRFNTTK